MSFPFKHIIRGKDPGLESGDLGSCLGSDMNWLCDFEVLWASVSLFANGEGLAPWSLRSPLALTLFLKQVVFAFSNISNPACLFDWI